MTKCYCEWLKGLKKQIKMFGCSLAYRYICMLFIITTKIARLCP
ncbi:hypothetical protein HMPREF1870_02757 [Bacteroidales bacterium KA00344]|nr:hypothetical protein HMPREF1870_02757 [Bacteroidales bacterium KA00344]